MRLNLFPFLIVMLTLFISGCENPECDDTAVCLPETESVWSLRAVYYDPGDGSGDFERVNSNRLLTIFVNGTFNSSGSLCDLDVNNTEPTSGTINEANGTLEFQNCFPNTSAEILERSFSINGDELILSFPCDEPCQWKFIRDYSE